MSLNIFTTTRKNSILAAVIIAAAFWFSPSASAAVIDQQLNYPTGIVSSVSSPNYIVQRFTAAAPTSVSQVDLMVEFQAGGGYCVATIRDTSLNLLGTSDQNTSTANGIMTFNFSSPVSLPSSGNYMIGWECVGVGFGLKGWVDGSLNSCLSTNYDYPSCYYGGAGSAYYVVSGEAAPTASMTFAIPADLQTLADFSNWQLNVDVPVLEEFYRIDVNYSTTIGGQTFSYKDVSYTYGGTLLKLIPKNYVLTSGNWTALAEIIVDSTSEIVASDQIDFTITIPAASGDPLPPSVTCEGGNWVSDNFCRVLRFLFVPSAGSLNLFTGLFTPLGDKIPFSYFGELKTAISGLNSSATPAFTLEPPQTMLDNIFTPFKVAFTWLLWLIFGFWLFRRLSHIEL